MLSRDYRDIAGGVLLIVFGGWVVWYSTSHYELGTFRRMAPGMFPMMLGVILAVFGAAIAIPAFFRAGPKPEIRIWTPLFVLAGVGAFAILVRPFGLIPAILGVTIISSLAELKVRPISLFLLCLSLCLIAWLTFRVGLGLPMPMYRWPY